MKNRKLDIQTYDPFYLFTASALKPEPMDMDVKVVIIGDSYLYQLLYFYNEDFKPHQNIDDLMLKPEVVNEVNAGNFHIYPIKTIDEGIEILTGVPAGQKRENNTYPENTIHHLVDLRLQQLAVKMKDFYTGEEDK